MKQLLDLTKLSWVQDVEAPLDDGFETLCVINEQLCRFHRGSIVVMDSELREQRVIHRSDDSLTIHDAADMANGDVILATHAGLRHMDAKGSLSDLS